MISVVILGAGNVGTHLFKGLINSEEITVKQWFSRNLKSIESYKHQTEITDKLESLRPADLYIISVSDDAVSEISEKLPFKNRLVVHTSGSLNIHDLDKKNKRGVFYPLQTFSKDKEVNFLEVPICLEVLDKKNLQILKDVASALGSTFHKVNTDQRAALHLSAVFVNNFVNQLYRIGHEISDSSGADFNILKPLIQETAKKIVNLSPYRAQTGPALRNDKKTIKRHLKMLEDNAHKNIYKLLTQSIRNTHGR